MADTSDTRHENHRGREMLSEYHRVVTGTAVHMPVRQVFLFTVPFDHLNHVRIHLCGRQAMILAKPDLKALAFDGF